MHNFLSAQLLKCAEPSRDKQENRCEGTECGDFGEDRFKGVWLRHPSSTPLSWTRARPTFCGNGSKFKIDTTKSPHSLSLLRVPPMPAGFYPQDLDANCSGLIPAILLSADASSMGVYHPFPWHWHKWVLVLLWSARPSKSHCLEGVCILSQWNDILWHVTN